MQSSKQFFYQKRSQSNGHNPKNKEVYKSGSMQELDPDSVPDDTARYPLKYKRPTQNRNNYVNNIYSPKKNYDTPMKFINIREHLINSNDTGCIINRNQAKRQNTEPSQKFDYLEKYINSVEEYLQPLKNNYNPIKHFEPKIKLNERIKLIEPHTSVKLCQRRTPKQLPLVFHDIERLSTEQSPGLLTTKNRRFIDHDKLLPLLKQTSQPNPDQFGITFQNPFFADAKMKISFYQYLNPQIGQDTNEQYSMNFGQHSSKPQQQIIPRESVGYMSLDFPSSMRNRNPSGNYYSLEKNQSDRPLEFQGVVYRKKMKSRAQSKKI